MELKVWAPWPTCRGGRVEKLVLWVDGNGSRSVLPRIGCGLEFRDVWGLGFRVLGFRGGVCIRISGW